MRRTSLLLAGLVLLAAACGNDSSPGAQPTAPGTSVPVTEIPSPTPSPSASPPRTIVAGAVFYNDTFKDKSKGWTEKSDATATYTVHTDYATPLYTVTANKAGFHLFPHPEFRGISKERLRDYEITATIQSTLSVGREDWFGVTCRDLNNKRYAFRMGLGIERDDRPWQIVKIEGGKSEILAEGLHDVGGSAWEVSGACVGGSDGGSATLAMKINGEVVGQVDDPAPYLEGYAGVYLLGKNGKTTVNVLTYVVRAASFA